MDVEATPPQPDEVTRALADELAETDRRDVDHWWQAGIDEALHG